MQELNFCGIWIDHSHALITFIKDVNAVPAVEQIKSSVERHHGPGQLGEVTTMADQTSADNRHEEQTRHFCKSLLEHIRDAKQIFVCGPGTAKYEFKHELERNHQLKEKLIGVETSDRLSDNEFKEYVMTNVKKFLGMEGS